MKIRVGMSAEDLFSETYKYGIFIKKDGKVILSQEGIFSSNALEEYPMSVIDAMLKMFNDFLSDPRVEVKVLK